ncbi:ATP-dependent endonuclease [Candidatus Bipolaricaulota bacterium]
MTSCKLFFGDILKSVVLANVRIFRWAYKEGDFLPGRVDIGAFVKNPRTQKTVASMLRIAGWQTGDFANNLTGQSDTVYGVLFETVQRKIDRLIRTNWSTHKRLTIILEHKGDYFTIRLKEPGSKTPPEYRSDGLKWYLTFLINFRTRSDDIKNYILLIDEPGLHLHPLGQKDTLRELQNLSARYDNQVVYTTHQTFLIDKNSPESVRVLKRKLDKTGARAKEPFYASCASGIANRKKDILTDKLLREALGFHVSDISPISERNLLVEGVFDREILHIANRHWQVLDLNEISVIPCTGASNIAKHAALYKENGLTVLCLYDSDDPGVSSFNKNDKVTEKEKVQVKSYTGHGDHSETMEDLIPDTIFASACKKWCDAWGIAEPVLSRPRMKCLKKLMQGPDKIERKHSLEDYLSNETKSEFAKYVPEFGVLKTMLEDLHKRL